MEKFVRIPQQNNKDYLWLNLAQVIYIAINDKQGTCKVFLRDKQTITCLPHQTRALLTAIEAYQPDLERQISPLETEEEF